MDAKGTRLEICRRKSRRQSNDRKSRRKEAANGPRVNRNRNDFIDKQDRVLVWQLSLRAINNKNKRLIARRILRMYRMNFRSAGYLIGRYENCHCRRLCFEVISSFLNN